MDVIDRRLEWEEVVKSGIASPESGKIASSFQERSPPLEGSRVILEAVLFVVSVLGVCVIAALS